MFVTCVGFEGRGIATFERKKMGERNDGVWGYQRSEKCIFKGKRRRNETQEKNIMKPPLPGIEPGSPA